MSDNLLKEVKSFPENSSLRKANEKLLKDPIPDFPAAGPITIDGIGYYALAAAFDDTNIGSYTFTAHGWGWAAIAGAGAIAGGFYVDPKTLIGKLTFASIVESTDVGFVTLKLFKATAAETAKQVALGGKSTEIRDAHEDFLAHDFFQVLDLVLVQHPGADSTATRPVQDVIVFQCRLPLTAHKGGHSLIQYLQVLAGNGVLASTRGKPEIGVHRIAFHWRQVVQLGKQCHTQRQR